MRVQGRSLIIVFVLLALIAWARPAAAAPFGDCAPIGTLENFDAGRSPDIRTWNAMEFRVMDGQTEKTVVKYGKSCHQTYTLKSGLKSSNLEIIKNYAVGLPGLGFQITNPKRGETDDIHATRSQAGVETWVHIWASNGDSIGVKVLTVAPFKPSLAPASADDCSPLVGLLRFQPNAKPITRTFAEESFRVLEGKEAKSVSKSGRTCRQTYALKPGAPATSDVEIIRNYEVALPAEGFRITNGDRGETDEIDATRSKDGVETWVRVWPSNDNQVSMLVLQIEAFKPSLAALGPKDCPLVPSLENFEAGGPPQTRTFDREAFHVDEPAGGKTVTKEGKACRQTYALKPGIATKTDLEIIRNFAEGLPAAGFTIANGKRDPDGEIVATIVKGGTERWVRVWASNGNSIGVLEIELTPFAPSVAPMGPKDCPLVPALIDFAANGKPDTKPYDSFEFRTIEEGKPKTVTKAGKTCRQTYGLKPGLPGKTDLEIAMNYAKALPVAGFTITNTDRTDDGEVFATTTKDGVETWVDVWASNGNTISVKVLQIEPFKSSMKAAQTVEEPATPKVAIETPVTPQKPVDLALAAPAASPEKIKPDQGDFPYLAAIPGSTFTGGHASTEPFYVQPADAKQPELVANGSIVKEYQSPPGMGPGRLVSAYKTALVKAHWTIVSERQDQGVVIVAHFGENGRNLWASLHFKEHGYAITIADATIVQGRFAADLGAKCHIALTGVLFDFDSAALKPESDAVLAQVAALMARDPKLKLEVQGHTDNVGTEAYNQTLSEARARSVVTWLSQHKVAPDRLIARGYGKDHPIATNATDAGRAQNRRVEIANPACKRP